MLKHLPSAREEGANEMSGKSRVREDGAKEMSEEERWKTVGVSGSFVVERGGKLGEG